MRTHDNVENRAHFGAQLYSSGAIASYPQVRGVTRTALPTHIVHSAAFGPYGTNEMLYAKQLITDVPNESLTVFDRGFLSAEILYALTQHGTDRHFIIPAKSNTRWEVIEGDENDCGFYQVRDVKYLRYKSQHRPKQFAATSFPASFCQILAENCGSADRLVFGRDC